MQTIFMRSLFIRSLFMRSVLAMGVGVMVAKSPAAAEPKITETIEYYNVAGSTPQDLRKELNMLGPFDNTENKRLDGVTKWFVNWRYQYSKTGESCGVASATTDVKVTITMPRLKEDVPMPAELRQSFETYLNNLLTHEKGHGKIGIDIARRIEDGIAKLPAEPNCDRMGQVANELGRKLIKEANQQDIDYDARTRHGATQGARFP
jgi:predicted secreted Zn-dependent protease